MQLVPLTEHRTRRGLLELLHAEDAHSQAAVPGLPQGLRQDRPRAGDTLAGEDRRRKPRRFDGGSKAGEEDPPKRGRLVIPMKIHLTSGQSLVTTLEEVAGFEDEEILQSLKSQLSGDLEWAIVGDTLLFPSRVAAIELL